MTTTVRYEGRIRTIDAVREAGMETCVGGILNLGETPRQRVEMAFELAEIDPTSVPINLLNPRTGTKFGDRELMDPWDVVKWIAIFRLILPDALFRLCGGRVENLHELQPLAVKAGLNGVMMGNFLTTLGAEPADDREMFTELGLNVARQPDNGSNPRPDNRSGWLEGESPRTPVDDLIDSQAEADFWDPSTQLRVIKKKRQAPRLPAPAEARSGLTARAEARADAERPGPPAPRRPSPSGWTRSARTACSGGCGRSARPQGPRIELDGREVLLLCSNDYLGLAAHPGGVGGRRRRRPSAGAPAPAPPAWSPGTWSLTSGSSSGSPPSTGPRRRCCSAPATWPTPASIAALARRGEVVFSDELNHASIIDGCRLAGARTFVYRHRDLEHLAWGLAQVPGHAALIVTDGLFSMDGDVAPLGWLRELASRHGAKLMVDDAHAVGALGPGGRGSVAEAGLAGEVDVLVGTLGKSLGSYGAYACVSPRGSRPARQHRPAADLLDRPAARRRRCGGGRARRSSRRSRRGSTGCARTPRRCAPALAANGLEAGGAGAQIMPVAIGDPDRAVAICRRALEAGVYAQAIRPPTVPERHLAPAADGDRRPPARPTRRRGKGHRRRRPGRLRRR